MSTIKSITRKFYMFLVVVCMLALAFGNLGAIPAYAQAAATWYVAPTGNDSNSCSDTISPCLTINGAIGKASSGDTIYVATGTYTGTGTQGVFINKTITLSGGWDAGFATQSGLSTIDGQAVRRGVTVSSNDIGSTTIDHFRIENGHTDDDLDGAGIAVGSDFTLSNSIITNNISRANAGGILNFGASITITNTTISNNIAGAGHKNSSYSGGGLYLRRGSNLNTVILNNSTISGNRLISNWGEGSAIYNFAFFTANNSTISGNTGGQTASIYSSGSGNGEGMIFGNSTITDNYGGIQNYFSSSVSLQNSILAGNDNGDCSGTLHSTGYNLIGKGGMFPYPYCTFFGNTGDQVGTEDHPIKAGLGPLGNNGGSTFTHALLAGSPALNAGNPATPGSEAGACLATDQRGIVRSGNGPCDIGAYESANPVVVSIKLANTSPTAAAEVSFTVTFSEPVAGVDQIKPFNDFALATTGVKGASITQVSGSEDIYTVTLKTGSGNGIIRLNVLDHDTILDGSGQPLGGTGLNNGNYKVGPTYKISSIPVPSSPEGKLIDSTPTYTWTALPPATKYQYELVSDTTIIYSKIVGAYTCGPSGCSNTPTKKLADGAYKWHIRAMINGIWKNYSAYKIFTVAAGVPKAGFWQGDAAEFFVTRDHKKVDNFTVYINVYNCGLYQRKLVYTSPVVIVNNQFKYDGAFYFNGTFTSSTTSRVSLGFDHYYIDGCGYITGGPFYKTLKWKNSSQPLSADTEEFTLTIDESALNADSFSLDIETVDP